jgi:hypothetical protein
VSVWITFFSLGSGAVSTGARDGSQQPLQLGRAPQVVLLLRRRAKAKAVSFSLFSARRRLRSKAADGSEVRRRAGTFVAGRLRIGAERCPVGSGPPPEWPAGSDPEQNRSRRRWRLTGRERGINISFPFPSRPSPSSLPIPQLSKINGSSVNSYCLRFREYSAK